MTVVQCFRARIGMLFAKPMHMIDHLPGQTGIDGIANDDITLFIVWLAQVGMNKTLLCKYNVFDLQNVEKQYSGPSLSLQF